LAPFLLQDGGRQSRQVKLLCACVSLVLQRQPAALAESLPELLAFCIQARGCWPGLAAPALKLCFGSGICYLCRSLVIHITDASSYASPHTYLTSHHLPPILSCLQQSRHKQASELYRQLRDLEQAGG
jgi:hypothetical protein